MAKIYLSSATGKGSTEMSAFDQALCNAGAANFNLIYLSSILPPGSKVIVSDRPINPEGTWGDKLYVVMAQQRTSDLNKEVWAGIGWMQDKTDGKGLLVEHEGYSKAAVTADIKNSLADLAKNRRHKFGPIHMKLAGTTCTDGKGVCALVVAVFESEPWKANS